MSSRSTCSCPSRHPRRPPANGSCGSRWRPPVAIASGGRCTGRIRRFPTRSWRISRAAGYWGLLIDPQYGGGGASFASFAPFLTRMATIEPNLAGLASVHGCIGAVDPIRTFGTTEQKERYLPRLASGERLSAFALTEPCAGSDLTALRTQAVLDGDDYVVNGEKLFITNADPGADDRPGLPHRREARRPDRRPARS